MDKSLAKEAVLKIRPYQPGRPIEEVKRELGLRNAVKLASNENPLGPSPRAISNIKRALASLNRYPYGDCYYLRERLARKLNVDKKNLIFGNGSDEIIAFAIRTFLKEGEEAITAIPTFLIYKLVTIANGSPFREVPLKDFKYDLVEMKKMITDKTKLIFISNPNNPTGTYLTQEEIDTFLEGLPSQVVVFFDEAYFEFAEGYNGYPDILKTMRSEKLNIILTRTFSKASGLAGLRIGYGISRPDLIECMEKVRDPFNVNSLAQAGALGALKDGEYVLKVARIIEEGKEYLYKSLGEMDINFVPSATNFILVDTKTDGRGICKHLEKKGVIVRDMSAWDMAHFIRVTVGKKEENIRFIKAFKEVLKED